MMSTSSDVLRFYEQDACSYDAGTTAEVYVRLEVGAESAPMQFLVGSVGAPFDQMDKVSFAIVEYSVVSHYNEDTLMIDVEHVLIVTYYEGWCAVADSYTIRGEPALSLYRTMVSEFEVVDE